jgi:hypothetical protein
MRLVILGAVIGATLLGVLPASADEVVIRAGEGGVAIHERDGDRDGYRHRERWQRDYAECRWVSERIVKPSGRVFVRRYRSC